jgi:hypothetical protein
MLKIRLHKYIKYYSTLYYGINITLADLTKRGGINRAAKNMRETSSNLHNSCDSFPVVRKWRILSFFP